MTKGSTLHGIGDYSRDEARHFTRAELQSTLLLAKPAWQAKAACNGADYDLFFPERGASTRQAKEVCRGCPVQQECLDYALDNGEKFGIWGGKSERERRRIRRQRRAGEQEQVA